MITTREDKEDLLPKHTMKFNQFWNKLSSIINGSNFLCSANSTFNIFIAYIKWKVKMWVSNYSSFILSFFLPFLVNYFQRNVLPREGGGRAKQAWIAPALPCPALASLGESSSSSILLSTVLPCFWAPEQGKECFGEGHRLLKEWAACDWWWKPWHSWFLQTPGNCWGRLDRVESPGWRCKCFPPLSPS